MGPMVVVKQHNINNEDKHDGSEQGCCHNQRSCIKRSAASETSSVLLVHLLDVVLDLMTMARESDSPNEHGPLNLLQLQTIV